MSATMGLPDLGMITVEDVCFFVRQVARSTGLPLLVDGDTGYGEALNVMHMVRSFEDAGAARRAARGPAAAQEVRPPQRQEARDHRRDVRQGRRRAQGAPAPLHHRPHRRGGERGMEGALARAKAYMEAGADAIFPEALNTPEMFKEFAERMPGVKLLANMTEFGRTPFLTAEEFQEMGYSMVIWPVTSLRVANKAQAKLYETIARDGSAEAMLPEMQTRAELYDVIGLHDYEALDASIVSNRITT
jgi:methylisocitrate lyase